jgi:hypothetical protein
MPMLSLVLSSDSYVFNVARDHTGEREHAEQCHEAHGLVRKEEGRDDPNEEEEAIKALELDHQEPWGGLAKRKPRKEGRVRQMADEAALIRPADR